MKTAVPVSVDVEDLVKIKRMAESESVRDGRRVSISEVVRRGIALLLKTEESTFEDD